MTQYEFAQAYHLIVLEQHYLLCTQDSVRFFWEYMK